jgi:hypothetical protein
MSDKVIWAYLAFKDNKWGGTCSPTISKKSLDEFFNEFAADGYTIKPVFSREEYDAELATLD